MMLITRLDDSRIDYYRSLNATPASHSRDSVFIAEGETVVRALLESPLDVVSVFALPEYYDQFAELIAARNIPAERLLTATKEVMNDIVGFRLHQGVMAMGKQPAEPELRNLCAPVVVLDGIVNSENVGAILRNCEAFGVSSVVVGGGGSSPWLRRAVRASMGAVCSMNIHTSNDLLFTLTELREQYGFALVAAETGASAIPLPDYVFPERCALVFGSEGPGVSQKVLKRCTDVIAIPLAPEVASINVASATAIFLYALKNRKNPVE